MFFCFFVVPFCLALGTLKCIDAFSYFQHKFVCHDATLIYNFDAKAIQVLSLVLALYLPVSLSLNIYLSKNLAHIKS